MCRRRRATLDPPLDCLPADLELRRQSSHAFTRQAVTQRRQEDDHDAHVTHAAQKTDRFGRLPLAAAVNPTAQAEAPQAVRAGAARQSVAGPPKVGAIKPAAAMDAPFSVRRGGDRLVDSQKKREKCRLRYEIDVFDG